MKNLKPFFLLMICCFLLKSVSEAAAPTGVKAQSGISQGGFFTNQGMITPYVDSTPQLSGAIVTNFASVFVKKDSAFRYHYPGDSTWMIMQASIWWKDIKDPPAMLTKAQGDSYWKPISYTPSSSEIVAALGYTPYSSANPAGYISSVPAQSFASLTGKPTTLSGYGITDAYPLSTNPAGYITSITSSQVTTALGYSPYNGATNPNGYISTVPAQSFASLTGKPTTLAGYGIIDAYPLSGNPSGFLTTVPAQTFASLTGKPTTLTGYGITDAYSSSNPSGYVSVSGARSAISLTTTGSGAASYNPSTGALNIPTPTSTAAPYYNATTTTGGNAVFYLTSDKTLSGTALYTNVSVVLPIVNDATLNYTYGWTISGDKKTLTVNVRASAGINVALVGLTLLGVPANVVNGTPVAVQVIGQ